LETGPENSETYGRGIVFAFCSDRGKSPEASTDSDHRAQSTVLSEIEPEFCGVLGQAALGSDVDPRSRDSESGRRASNVDCRPGPKACTFPMDAKRRASVQAYQGRLALAVHVVNGHDGGVVIFSRWLCWVRRWGSGRGLGKLGACGSGPDS
jgi:hypothetical protein